MPSIVPMYTQSGEAHGLVETFTNAVEFNDFKNMEPKIKAIAEKEKKEDAKLVDVRYYNKRGDHERLTKHYCRWAGEPILKYNLIPGYTYSVPMGFVKEVNDIKTVKRSGLLSLDGSNVKQDGSPLDKDTFGDGLHLLYPAKFN